jgi:Domain of unknown function (DUF1707)
MHRTGEVPKMHEPRDHRAARPAGRGRLRASHADREQVIDLLKEAFVQDRLTKDEFDLRVSHALASRTHADLAALTADLPAAPPPRTPVPARSRRPEKPTVTRGAGVIAATTVLAGGAWAGALLSQTDSAAWGLLVWTLTFVWIGLVILVGSVTLESRLQRRSGRQLPSPRCG